MFSIFTSVMKPARDTNSEPELPVVSHLRSSKNKALGLEKNLNKGEFQMIPEPWLLWYLTANRLLNRLMLLK